MYTYRHTRSLHDALPVVASSRAFSCLLGSPLGNCPTNASRTFREKRLENRNDRYLSAISSSIVANSSFADGTGASSTSAGNRMLLSGRSEEHTSELQSLMRISYAVFCLKTTKNLTLKHKLPTNEQVTEQ